MEDLLSGKKVKTGSFQSLGLDRTILNGINRMGYKTPTPIQRKTLPLALAGIDLVCMARTGSGKTCAFLLPIVQKLGHHRPSGGVRAIVLAPTRELAMQTFKFARDIAKFSDLNIINIVGGDPIEAQFESLASRPDVIVATPGRLMHHLREISTFKLNQVQVLVFDEADRLFEMGFAEQLNEIVRECPVERQTLLFSATMPKALVQFSRAGLRDPQLIRLDADAQLSEELRLAFFTVRSNEKIAAFLYLVRKIIPTSQVTIVFTATRHHSELLHALLERIGVTSTVVYGAMDQDVRSQRLKAFRTGTVRYMIVTDLAARGIDVPLLNNVINFHFPPSPKLFVHRCGRAARQGRIGYAFSLVEPEELAFMADVYAYLGKTIVHSEGGGGGGGSSSSSSSSSREVDEMALEAEEREVESDDDHDDDNVSNDQKGTKTQTPAQPLSPYSLENMTPHQVHVGLLPQDVVDRENDYFRRARADDEELEIMERISDNSMKQYRRTRTEASRQGVKTAKTLTKQSSIRFIHPLIVGCDPTHCTSAVTQKNEYVRMLQTFRPHQTVFETGIGTASMGHKKLAHEQQHPSLSGATGKQKLSKGSEMMRALRAATATSLERNRKAVALQLAAGRAQIQKFNDSKMNEDEEDGNKDYAAAEAEEEEVEEESSDDGIASGDEYDFTGNDEEEEGPGEEEDEADVPSKKKTTAATNSVRLSITERKRLKKKGLSQIEIRDLALTRKAAADKRLALSEAVVVSGDGDEDDGEDVEGRVRIKKKKKTAAAVGGVGVLGNYKHSSHYMAYGDEDTSFAEEMLQPQSGLRGSESLNAMKLDRALLDISPDDAVGLNNKQKMTRWDAKKNKFVKQTIQEMAESQKKGMKRMRSENGVISATKSSLPAGQMYEKWKKKSRREVGGQQQDTHDGAGGSGAWGEEDAAGRSRNNNNNNRNSSKRQQGDSSMPNFKVNTKVKDELRSLSEIRKVKAAKENLKLKNMKKDKRSKLEASARQKKKAAQAKRGNAQARPSRKSKMIVRY